MRLFASRLLPLLVCSLLAGCGGSVAGLSSSALPPLPPPAPASIWAGAWGASMTNTDGIAGDSTGADQTFRFLVTPTLGGTSARVRFSNIYGKTPVTLGAAHLGIGADGSPAVDPAHDVALTFNGQPGTTLAAGGVITSDPAPLTFAFGQTLAITVYLKGNFGPVSRHDALFITNYATPAITGDGTTDTAGTAFTQTLPDWLLVSGVDVYGQYTGTLALFGSSTTDGYKSNYSSDQVYPTPNKAVPGQHTSRLSDQLAKRLNAAGYRIGVVNAGVPGDTVTKDVTNTTGNVENANQRIAQDVLSLPSLLGMVTYFGSIDIRSPDCQSAPAIEAATQQMVATAAAARVPVVLATIPPSAFCTNPTEANFGPFPNPNDPFAGGATPGPENGGEVQRIALNTWIRQTGVTLTGVAGVADFDSALADPARPNFLLPLYNSGDNYHPNGAGYGAESSAIPLAFLGTP